MKSERDETVLLFKRALEKIRSRSTSRANAWELHLFSRAMISIEDGDWASAADALDRLECTPESVDLEAVWKTQSLTMEEIEGQLERVVREITRA